MNTPIRLEIFSRYNGANPAWFNQFQPTAQEGNSEKSLR